MFTQQEAIEFDKNFGEGSTAWVEEVNDYYKVLSNGEELWYSIFGPEKIMQLRDILRQNNIVWTPNMVAYALVATRVMVGLFQSDIELEMLMKSNTGGVTH